MTGRIAIEDVKRLDVRPGDRLLFTVAQPLSTSVLDHLGDP